MTSDFVYHYEPPEEAEPAGVRPGWLYIGRPAVGEELIAVPVSQVTDGEGGGFIIQTGEQFTARVVD